MTQQSIPENSFWSIGQLPITSFAHWQANLTSFPAKWPVGRVRSVTWHHSRNVATCGLLLISLGVPADNETCWAIDKSRNCTHIHVRLSCPTAVKSKSASVRLRSREAYESGSLLEDLGTLVRRLSGIPLYGKLNIDGRILLKRTLMISGSHGGDYSRVLYSRIWRHVVRWKSTDVPKECITTIFGVEL
jgi:hypothetical protein